MGTGERSSAASRAHPVVPEGLPPRDQWIEVREGGTRFLLPQPPRPSRQRGPGSRAPVFYNPAMALPRDLHVSVVEGLADLLGRRITVWDVMAASGIRGLRAVHETASVERLLSTDLQPDALQVLEENQRLVGDERALSRRAEAREVPPEAPFDLVDLDPYGTPMPFLETAVRATAAGGVLGVTATDLAVLAGPERAACELRYGARPLRNYLCREAGLRILLGALARTAARQGRAVHPMLSYVHDHHARSYVRLDPARGDEELPLQPVPYPGYAGPPLVGGRKGGPLWTGPLHDPTLLQRLRPSPQAEHPAPLRRWLEELKAESLVDVLFYYESGEVGRTLRVPSMPAKAAILGALTGAGWRASPTPMDPSGWRTDAPWEEVARIVERAARSSGTRSSLQSQNARV